MPIGIHPGFLVVLLIVASLILAIVAVVWLLVRYSQERQAEQIRTIHAGPAAGSTPTNYGLRTPDGRWWWDGSAWQPVPPPEEPTEQGGG